MPKFQDITTTETNNLRMPVQRSMILDSHPDRNWPGRRFIGYWAAQDNKNLPNPKDFVDESWDANERAFVVQRLKAGTPYASWLGYSWCRFGCTRDDTPDWVGMGDQCFTAEGSWVWPEGFAHYVEKHGVRPPQEFVDYLRSLPVDLATELDSRIPRIEAIKAHWEPHMKGEGCSDKGTTCTFQAEGYPRCEKVDGNFTESSSYCLRASHLAGDDYKAERERHAAAIAPFCKVPWEVK